MKSKRIVSLLLVISLIVSAFTVSLTVSASAESKYKYGDTDMNGEIEITDAALIQKDIANIVTLSDEQKAIANSTGDDQLNILSATYIQKYLANLSPHGKVGEDYKPDEPTTEPSTKPGPPEPTTEPTEPSTEEPTINPDVPLADTVNEGTILQAWNWSFNTIIKNLPAVKDAGFTTVQVSPPNEVKEGTKTAKMLQSDNKNGWWMLYQPAGFQINNSADSCMGTKEEFIKMCEEAHKIGVKIIVDTVINHMGTCDNEDRITSTNPMDHVTPKAKVFEPEIYNGKLFHSPWAEMTYKEDPSRYSQDESTYDLTRNCTSRLPDLKTEDSTVQKVIYEYMKELVDSGADGFRFDAAKHIETEKDLAKYKSEFWNNTLEKVRKEYAGKKECFAYGEILNNCGVGRSYSMYTSHMNVTDSSAFYTMKDAVSSGSGNATPFYPSANFTAENAIMWDESHDTYTDPNQTLWMTVDHRNRMWALCAGRAEITCVYLARPDDSTSLNPLYNITMGEGAKTSWANNATAQINKFHNRHIGDSEYCTANSGGRAYIERGDSGCIIVGLGNTKGGNVSLANHKLKKGIYIDQMTGNQFTVTNNSSGSIKGQVGSTGIACIEFLKESGEDPTSPTDPTSDKPYPTSPGCYTVVITNSMNWENIFFYCWSDELGEVQPWPGMIMQYCKTNDFGQKQYCAFVPYEQNSFIVSNGKNDTDPDWAQTGDSVITEDTGIYFDEEKDDKGRYVLKFWDISDY